MIQTTRWCPDTCKCQLLVDWNDTTPESDRPLILNRFEWKCPRHFSLSDNDAFVAVVGECQRKNYAERTVRSAIMGIDERDHDDIILKEALNRLAQEQGVSAEIAKILAATDMFANNLAKNLEAARVSFGMGNSEYKWSFTEDRVLEIEVPARTTTQQKNAIKAALLAKYGDKVKLGGS